MTQFLPVLLGSDINVYGMARAFHEAYGVKSVAFAHFQLAPTRYSSIVDVRVDENFDKPSRFVDVLVHAAKEFKREQPDRALLLIACGDVYANLLSVCAEQLRPWYAFHTIAPELAQRLTIKSSFYELCEQYDLPHPKTVSLTAADVLDKQYQHLPFEYPVAMKPADSVQWLDIDFEGRKKAFIFTNPDELDTIIQRAYAAGYTGTMVIQDFIPGDDSRMRVLNAYVDSEHHVRMMMLGHPLLEDPSPIAVGNYAIIEPDYNEAICKRVAAFLQAIEYVGVANFDMKYDERDGEYKLFEINLRQGRSSFFVTLNGANLARYFVEDLVEHTPYHAEPEIIRGDKLWLQVPRSFVTRYVAAGEAQRRAVAMLSHGKWGTTLQYKRDMNPLRWLMLLRMNQVTSANYKRWFVRKGQA